MMGWWVTLDDRGYRLAAYAEEPDNAIAGPYKTPEDAHAMMDRCARQQDHAAYALGYVICGAVVLVIVSIAWGLWA